MIALCKTPDYRGSLRYDAISVRSVSWLYLWNRTCEKRIRVLIRHLYHITQKLRIKQTRVVLKEATQH